MAVIQEKSGNTTMPGSLETFDGKPELTAGQTFWSFSSVPAVFRRFGRYLPLHHMTAPMGGRRLYSSSVIALKCR
jgi:hypothetical protein